VIEDTMKFAFLFFEFFIPYTVGFWIIFGGKEESETDWKNFNDLTYSVWTVSVYGIITLANLLYTSIPSRQNRRKSNLQECIFDNTALYCADC